MAALPHHSSPPPACECTSPNGVSHMRRAGLAAGPPRSPEPHTDAAGIKEQAVLPGMFDCFELWDPTRYKQLAAGDAERATEAYGML